MEQNPLQKLTEWELEEQLDTILSFLSQVHPSLNTERSYRPCVEIRPIYRGEGKNFMLSKSLNIWDLDEESISRLRVFLERHNGQPTCLYYSVYTYDNNAKAVTTKGTLAKPGKITASSAIATDEIALDFDDIGFDEYIVLVERFEAIGIYALWVSSGHGYQAHILLSQSLKDKELLKRFVYKFRSKGFDADPACVDPARVMRLPGTYNCKCFSDSAYADEVEPPRCDIVQDSVHRYDLEFIIEALDRLPTVSETDEIAYVEMSKSIVVAPVAESLADPEEVMEEDTIRVTRIEYPYLDNFDLPDAIKRMLSYTPRGLRNKSLGFMIGFFRQHYRLSKGAIEEIMTIWAANACDPEYPSNEFKSDFSRLYKYNGLPYDSALAKQFGAIDFGELIELRKRDILIPAAFFKDFRKLDGKTVRLYLAIKLLEHMDEDATIDSICEVLRISDRALRPTMKDLLKSGHAYVSKGNRRSGIPNTYHTHRAYSVHEGYLKLSYNDVRAYVNELKGDKGQGNNELKLYLFMRYKFFAGECFMSQKNLGDQLGLARQTITGLVVKLEECKFIKIRKIYRLRNFASCEYTLLR